MADRASSLAIRVATSADVPAIESLLTSAALPLDGWRDAITFVGETDGRIVACAALEVRGSAALLRSVAVAGELRGRGYGEAIVHAALAHADSHELRPVVLLTTTADTWFPRFGFVRTERDAVPAALLASTEFVSACPASAVVMVRI